MGRRHYALTLTAENDLREARAWSLNRWGSVLTAQYFADLHAGAEYIAANHHTLLQRDDLLQDTGLGIYPVREHYIVYVPVSKKRIVIVAFIRQGRDVPGILRKAGYRIRQELKEIRTLIDSGKLKF